MFRADTTEELGHCVVDVNGIPVSYGLATYAKAVKEAERINKENGIKTPFNLLEHKAEK